MNVNNKFTFGVVSLANFAANAAIGTAAATVDIVSVVSIPQTAAGKTLTIPTPTINEPGQVFTVLNTGTVAVTVGGVSIATGQQMKYTWSGTAWLPLPAGGSVAAMVGATSVAAGTAGTVPTPAAGSQFKFLNGGAVYTNAIPSWLTATAYSAGDEVYDPATNLIYRRIAAGTSLGTFTLDAANWQLMGGGIQTANNGLTVTGANVQLGGTLVKNTVIEQATFSLTLNNTTDVQTGINMINSTGNGFCKLDVGGYLIIGTAVNDRMQLMTNNNVRAEFLGDGTFIVKGPNIANISGMQFANLLRTSPVTAGSTPIAVDATGNVVIAPARSQVQTRSAENQAFGNLTLVDQATFVALPTPCGFNIVLSLARRVRFDFMLNGNLGTTNPTPAAGKFFVIVAEIEVDGVGMSSTADRFEVLSDNIGSEGGYSLQGYTYIDLAAGVHTAQIKYVQICNDYGTFNNNSFGAHCLASWVAYADETGEQGTAATGGPFPAVQIY